MEGSFKMINDGIYEQIINTKLQKELDQIDLTQYDIDLEKLDAGDARKALTIYISVVLQKAIMYLRDEFGSSKEKESLVAQIRLCNSVIDEIEKSTGEKDFADFLSKKGYSKVLTFEYPFLILIRSIIISERIFLLIHCILHCKLRSVSGS